jgi:hypothetical protein
MSTQERTGAPVGSEGDAAGVPVRFGNLSPAEAARKRWEGVRDGSRAASSEERIVASLRAKAEKGDVQAARELREWLKSGLDQAPTDISTLDLLTPEQREIVRGWLQSPA